MGSLTDEWLLANDPGFLRQQAPEPGLVVKTTTFECGCVTAWKVEPLTPTPLTCPVHGKIWAHTESEPA